MEPILVRKEGHTILYHVTTEDAVCSILQRGILPSAYGDLAVNNNQGKGVYALSSAEAAERYSRSVFDDEQLRIVSFRYDGIWYECIDEIFSAEDIEEGETEKYHVGFLVIPNNSIPASNIISVTEIN